MPCPLCKDLLYLYPERVPFVQDKQNLHIRRRYEVPKTAAGIWACSHDGCPYAESVDPRNIRDYEQGLVG